LGKDIEPAVNRHIEGALPYLPESAAEMCDYLLGFASPRPERRTLPPCGGWLQELTVH